MKWRGSYSVLWNAAGPQQLQEVVTESDAVTQQCFLFRWMHSTSTHLQLRLLCVPVLPLLFPHRFSCTGAGYAWNFNGATVASGSGQGPYSLVWNTAGPYTVNLTVTENGCVSALGSQPVTINAIPDAAITATPAVCVGQNNSISFSGTANPGANYVWTSGSGTVNSGSGQDLIRSMGCGR